MKEDDIHDRIARQRHRMQSYRILGPLLGASDSLLYWGQWRSHYLRYLTDLRDGATPFSTVFAFKEIPGFEVRRASILFAIIFVVLFDGAIVCRRK